MRVASVRKIDVGRLESKAKDTISKKKIKLVICYKITKQRK